MDKLIKFLRTLEPIESRIRTIEQMDKDCLSLDEQEELINEYNKLWDRLNECKHKNIK